MRAILMLPLCFALATGCATTGGRAAAPRSDVTRLTGDEPPPEAPLHHGVEVGVASYYGSEHAGKRTASGQRFDPDRLTAAHPSLPFGTRVRVTNLANGRHVVVTITDRGPTRRGRIIDVSHAAARTLGFARAGTARVRVQVVHRARSAELSAPRPTPSSPSRSAGSAA